MSYYVDMNGKTAGPFSIEEVAELYQSKAIHAGSLYARPNAREWLPLQTIMALIKGARKAAPPIHQTMVHPSDSICLRCGTIGQPRMETPGSFAAEVMLWLLLIVPGAIYTVWRLASKRPVCPTCRSPGMILAGSPRGRERMDLDSCTERPGKSSKIGESSPGLPLIHYVTVARPIPVVTTNTLSVSNPG